MTIANLANKKILIVGFGREGQATVQFIKNVIPNVLFDVVDKSQGEDYLSKQRNYDLAIKSPGIKPEFLRIPYTTATNIFFGHVKGMTIGVTGTKGKSTTASLIYAILKQAGKKVHLVGNIGKPMLSELLLSNTKEDIWVCELSSFQLSDIRYSPHIGLLINLFPDHMDFHGSKEAYYQAKENIVKKMGKDDYFIYNPSFPRLKNLVQHVVAHTLPFEKNLPFPESSVSLLGRHNIDNIRAAITVAKLLHIHDESIATAVQTFQPLRHRLQCVGTYKDITFYDDAISTTPESTLAALAALPKVGTILLGGQDRGYDFSQLVVKLAQYDIPNIVLFPESGKKILHLLRQQKKYSPQVVETTSMKEAVMFAYKHTPKGVICLLSTASPSYSIWKNFEEKGDQFQELVKKLGSR